MRLEALRWLHCSMSGRLVLEYIIGTQSSPHRSSRLPASCAVVRVRSRVRSYTKRVSILKTSGNEVYYTASSLLVTLKNSCSKVHCQKFFRLKLLSYQIVRVHDKPAVPPRGIAEHSGMTATYQEAVCAAHAKSLRERAPYRVDSYGSKVTFRSFENNSALPGA